MAQGARSSRPRASPNRLSSSARSRMAPGVLLRAKVEDLVAEQRGELEIELLGGRLHLRLEQPDQRFALLGVRGALGAVGGGTPHPRIREPGGEADVPD